jgi:protoporphyrinogen oxidase
MKITVLGAGPAGMTAAWELSNRGHEVTIVDRHAFVGGAAASQPVGEGGARMDFGPHAFHLKDPEINRIFLDHVGCDCPTKKRNERILVRGGLFRYPLEITEVISHLTPGYLLWMGTAFVMARCRLHIMRPGDGNFEEWGVNRFGRPLYEFTCGNYTEKVWGVRPKTLSAKLAQQKLKELRIRDLIAKFFGLRGQEHKQYWEDYAYPEDGIGTVYENMAKEVGDKSGRLVLGSPVVRLLADQDRVRAVTVRNSEGREEDIACDAVVNTIPLTHVAAALDAGESGLRLPKAGGLRYRGLILINVTFNRDRVTPYDWVYLLDGIFRCNRFTEQKNMGGRMIPAGKTVICFELGASPGDALWDAPDATLERIALEDIRKIEFMPEEDIESFHVSRLEDAYPMYTLDFDTRLDDTLAALANTRNLFSVGRQGLFLNNDIHDSMEMGLRAARILDRADGTAEWYRFASDYVRGKIERTR